MSTGASVARIRECFHGLIYAGAEMRQLVAALRVIAATDEVVLVLGESGTGKELVARAVHEESGRKGHPFVPFNCSALSCELIESRLFGYKKGAFTGAYADRQGVISAAAGGSVFLDEIGDLTLDAQGALLRFLGNREIQPVGGTKPVIANVRVIAATNRDLRGEVESRRFRKDLYYRLNVATLVVPPLRSRSEDVRELAHHFARVYSNQYGKALSAFTREEMARLIEHQWPGNVRELESCIKRLILFGELDIEKEIHKRHEPARVWRSLSAEEKNTRVMESLESNGWSVALSATRLGISRRTVQRILRNQKQNTSGKASA